MPHAPDVTLFRRKIHMRTGFQTPSALLIQKGAAGEGIDALDAVVVEYIWIFRMEVLVCFRLTMIKFCDDVYTSAQLEREGRRRRRRRKRGGGVEQQ